MPRLEVSPRMPRELITIQVGQCGNQVGRRFWEMALAEHSNPETNPHAIFGESMTSFFRNVDTRFGNMPDLPFENGRGSIRCLKARAILVDMEQGPVTETLRGPLGELFDQTQLITDVSGAGNNFSHGHFVYGPKYGDEILDAVRRAAERCDSLQSFFLMHSLGGGTGSGLGTFILSMLKDEFPEVHRFCTSIFPSRDDDVVTSPYNAVLALQQLTAHADCVLPVDNQSLMDLTSTSVAAGVRECKPSANAFPPVSAQARGGGGGFDDMNDVLAKVLIDLTASMRFAGDLNVDLGEITTNLVPYPRMHYLMCSLSPLGRHNKGWSRGSNASHHLRQICNDAFSRRTQLMQADPRTGSLLACALLFRGQDISLADVTTNVNRLQSDMRMVSWNREGFKIGLCSTPSLYHAPGASSNSSDAPSLLCLSNNCCVASTLSELDSRFTKLYSRRAMLHHYSQFMDPAILEDARHDLIELVEDYKGLDGFAPVGTSKSRIPGGLRPMALRAGPLF